jgi:hypothetical protein
MNNTKNRSDCGSGGRRFETDLPPFVNRGLT